MTTQPLTSNRIDFDNANDVIEYYFQQGWTDGLPLVSPTPEIVQQFLDYVDRAPSEILGTELTKGSVITMEKVAVHAVMAGCLPEYLPVVFAAIEAMCEPKLNLHAMTVSTMGSAVLTVINGPLARELKINSGVSVVGPGHRANATIGRAIRLTIINVTGSVPGQLDKATLGHAGKYTMCIAEAEEASPWEPLHVERGLSPDQSAVTVFAALSPTQVANYHGNTPETILPGFHDAMFAAGYDQSELIILLGPEHVGLIGEAGWTKTQVKEFLSSGTVRADSETGKMRAVAKAPENLTVIVAGGAAGPFSDVIPLWGGGVGSQSVTREIRVPAH